MNGLTPEYVVLDEAVHMSEDDLAAVAGLRSESRTLVLARDMPMAIAWCKANGIEPRATTTTILGPGSGRGIEVRDQDRVVFVGDVRARRDYDRIMGALMPALHRVGGRKIEWVEEA